MLNTLLVGPAASPPAGAVTADPLAIPNAKWLMQYMKDLSTFSSNKVVSGQFHKSYVDIIQSQTGIRVGLLMDSFNDARSGWLTGFNAAPTRRQEMLDHWNAGGIIQCYMPFNNPKNQSDERDLDFTNADMVAARTPGNAIFNNLKWWLDQWATHAQWLMDRNVPIMIRPLHEHNCCFWYKDKADLPNFYRYIFNYLTGTKGLHNLLFAHCVSIWGGDNGPPSDKHQYMTFYPGDAYIDILGFDLYRDLAGSVTLVAADFAPMAYFRPVGKPIAITEFGPDDSTPSAAHADYRKLMTGIKAFAPEVVYWAAWSVEWSMSSAYNDNVLALLNDPWTANLLDIPPHP